MESILKMMGIDSEELMSQASDFLSQVRQLVRITEKNHAMLLIISENLPEGDMEKINRALKEIDDKYDKLSEV